MEQPVTDKTSSLRRLCAIAFGVLLVLLRLARLGGPFMLPLLFILLPPLILWFYLRVVGKMAASVRAAPKTADKSLFEKISLKAFFTSNLAPLVFLGLALAVNLVVIFFSGTSAATPYIVVLNFILSPIGSGYIAGYIANKSEVLNGALSQTLLLLVSVVLDYSYHPAPSAHAFPPIVDALLDYGSPFWGALGGYLRILYATRYARRYERLRQQWKLRRDRAP